MTGDINIFNKAINAGHSAAWDQDWNKAAENYQKAVDEFPENPKALRNLALSLFQLKNLEQSLHVYRHAASADSTDSLTMERIALIAERLGQIDLVVDYGMQASAQFMRNNHTEKAVENWLRVIMVDPTNTEAHSNLAQVYEKTGRNPMAIKEYMALAAIFQNEGQQDKAALMVDRSLELDPNHPDSIHAKDLLSKGKQLKEPPRIKGGTGPLRMADIRQMESPEMNDQTLGPISEARKIALTRMANVLFELSIKDDEEINDERKGVDEIVSAGIDNEHSNGKPALIKKHLGQAIDAQTHGKELLAVEELEQAFKNGFSDPAIYFDLGLLYAEAERLESALRYLEHSLKHQEYQLAARLLMGGIHLKKGKPGQASSHYLEALKIADSSVVPLDQAESIRQLYEPIIESFSREKNDEEREEICSLIEELLNKPGWREQVKEGRSQLPEREEDSMLLPLAELITQTKGSQVIDSMRVIRDLIKQKKYRSAMEEAYFSLQYAPNYLPLHSLICEILILQDNKPEALAKISVMAEAYRVRGEFKQSINLLRQIVQLDHMDMSVRHRLIEQLISQGQMDEALEEYMNLAELYYNQAELDLARNTYTTALRVCRNTDPGKDANTRILKRMADIDMQRLDLRQACRIYEQIKTINPDDPGTRSAIIDLYIRLGKKSQADAEIGNYVVQLSSQNKRKEAAKFLENLLTIHPEEEILVRHLAEEYRLAGDVDRAVGLLKELKNIFEKADNKHGAIQVLETIISLVPQDKDRYQIMINNLKELK
ncbi:tetratricopeptide repeat protein [Chloroflexota bacterium]